MPELLLSLFITQFCDNRIFGLIFAWVLTGVCVQKADSPVWTYSI